MGTDRDHRVGVEVLAALGVSTLGSAEVARLATRLAALEAVVETAPSVAKMADAWVDEYGTDENEREIQSFRAALAKLDKEGE